MYACISYFKIKQRSDEKDLNRIMFHSHFHSLLFRVYAPAVISPDVFKLIPPDIPVSKKARRNLILLAKVLQALSNGVIGAKEAYMLPLKPFIDQHTPGMHKFLNTVASDPLIDEDATEISPWRDFDGKPANPVSVFDLNLADLFEFHRILYSVKDRLISLFTEKRSESPVFHCLLKKKDFAYTLFIVSILYLLISFICICFA